MTGNIHLSIFFESGLCIYSKGLFALHRKIWFGVCKKIENFVITNFFVFVIAFALETC